MSRKRKETEVHWTALPTLDERYQFAMRSWSEGTIDVLYDVAGEMREENARLRAALTGIDERLCRAHFHAEGACEALLLALIADVQAALFGVGGAEVAREGE